MFFLVSDIYSTTVSEFLLSEKCCTFIEALSLFQIQYTYRDSLHHITRGTIGVNIITYHPKCPGCGLF